jgi:UbiD family decarboxylase
MQDLHEFINYLEKNHPDEIYKFDEEVERDYEITAIISEMEKKSNPLVIFSNVRDSDFPIVVNVFGSMKRIALSIATTPQEFRSVYNKRLSSLIKPELVKSKPFKEKILIGKQVDLNILPIIKHFPVDAGKYITSGITVTKNPETGIRNMGIYRIQLAGKRKLRISFHSRRDAWRIFGIAEKMGKPLPISIVIGAHPALYLAASARVPFGVDEYEIAGALLQRPVELVKGKTVDVESPALAEIVIEGEVLPHVREDEGPFSEFTGYATGRSTKNVINVKAIRIRENAFYQDITPGHSREHILLINAPLAAQTFYKVKELVPNLKDIYWPFYGCQLVCFLSLNDPIASGQPVLAGVAAIAMDPNLKIIVVVDEDIDVKNEEEVLWAVSTRVLPHEDIHIVKNIFQSRLDPTATEDGVASKVIIDATKSKDWPHIKVEISKDMKRKVLKKLEALGFLKPLGD